MFSYSQDDWESNLNLTYPLFKLNGQRTSRLHVKLLYRGALYVTIWLCSIRVRVKRGCGRTDGYEGKMRI